MIAVVPLLKNWGLAILLALCLPFLFTEGPLSDGTELDRALWDLGHIGYFALAIVALRRRLDIRTWPHWLAISIAVFLVSIMLEYLRYEVGQTRSWTDIERNLIGAWFGLFWLNRGGPQVWVGRVIATGLVLNQLSLVATAALTQHQLANQLPMLSGLEQTYEEDWWQGAVTRTDERAWVGQYSLALELDPDQFSSARLTTLPADWSGYKTLALAIYNPRLTPLTLSLRVDDARHERRGLAFGDRFNESVTTQFGWNLVEIPLERIARGPSDRELDLNDIARLEIFAVDPGERGRIFLDQLQLK